MGAQQAHISQIAGDDILGHRGGFSLMVFEAWSMWIITYPACLFWYVIITAMINTTKHTLYLDRAHYHLYCLNVVW